MKRLQSKLVINNVTLLIIIGQVVVYLAINSGLMKYNFLALDYNYIFLGEFWRVISFVFIPPASSPLWSLLNWYILYLMGSNLEHYWGAKHYNLYLLIAIVLTNATAFIFNLSVGTNYFFQSSIFLAFAFLNPDFQVRLFFIIPVKIKWIALVMWAFYLWSFIVGSFGARVLIVASIINFLIFFSKDIYFKIRYRTKKVQHKIEKEIKKNTPNHICAYCGKTDLEFPYMDFRYCSKCNPEQCYCEEHIQNHDHK